MNGRSPNVPSPRFSGGTPSRNQHQFVRQPLHLQPNSPYMSPRGSYISSPRNSSGSSDFIPLGVSSPVRPRQHSWNHQNRSNNSSFSGLSSPPSFNSSPNFSPYKRKNFRGNFRGRGSFNSSNNSSSNSPHISLYIDKEALKDPWAQLEGKLKHLHTSGSSSQNDSQETNTSTIDLNSDSDSPESDDS